MVLLGTGQFQWSIGTNGTIGTNGKAPYSNGSIVKRAIIIMNIPRSISQPGKTSSLLYQVKARYNLYEYSSFYKPTMQNKFAFTPRKNALIIIEYSSFYKPTTQNKLSFTPSKKAPIIIKNRLLYIMLAFFGAF